MEQKQEFPEKLEGYVAANKLFLNGENRPEISAVGYFVTVPNFYLNKKKDDYLRSSWVKKVEDDEDDDLYGYSEAYLQMTDCNKSVRIELEFDSKSKYQNSLDKLEAIIKIANEAQQHLVKARKNYLENLEIRKKLDKTKEKKQDDGDDRDEFIEALRGL